MITPPRSPETDALVQALLTVMLGETVSYDSLAQAAGITVESLHSRMGSARHIAQRDEGAVFQTIRGTGLRRLSPDDAAAIGKATRGGIRRTTGRALKAMGALANSGNGLSPEARRAYDNERAVLGTVQAFTTSAAMKRVEAIPEDRRAREVSGKDMARRLLAAFTKPKPKD